MEDIIVTFFTESFKATGIIVFAIGMIEVIDGFIKTVTRTKHSQE